VLERSQLKAYLAVYLRNHRYVDFARFAWERRREGVTFLRNMMRPAPRPLTEATTAAS